jgi:hypothetical protein
LGLKGFVVVVVVVAAVVCMCSIALSKKAVY